MPRIMPPRRMRVLPLFDGRGLLTRACFAEPPRLVAFGEMLAYKPLIASLLTVALASCTGGGTTGEPSASPQGTATGSPLPVGNWWAGEIHAVSTFESSDGSTTCTEVWDVDMDLYDNNGQVTGSGNGDLLAQRACRSDDPDFDVKSQAEHFDFNLRGKFSNKRFTIQLIVTS